MKTTSRITAALAAALALATASTHAATINVSGGGGNLQAAINSASPGDVLRVSPGTYTPITTDNKAITIESTGGASVTIIDGGGTSRCAELGRGGWEEPKTVLTGFTLRNGRADKGGGALGGTLNNCILSGNTAYRGGGACDSTLNNCTLTGNSVEEFWGSYWEGGEGGGAYYSTLNNCTVTGNTADYGGGAAGGTLNNCTVTGNTADLGGGAYFGTLNNCTVTGNSGWGGGAAWSTLDNCTVTGNSGGVVRGHVCNSIVWGNTAGGGDNYDGNDNSDGYVELYYSCTHPMPSAGIGNIAADPRFMDAANGNYRLQAGSPCIDAGINAAVVGETDLDGAPRIQGGRVDMGAYEYRNTATVAPAAVLYVDASRPDDSGDGRSWATAKKTIPDALACAAAGAEIVVTNGVYQPIATFNAPITVRSVNGASVTIIDGGGTQRCATLDDWSWYPTNTVLTGFTLRNGRADEGGGALGGTLNNCILSGNTAGYYGGGARNSTLNNCTVTGNTAGEGGGVASCFYVYNSIIWGNTGGNWDVSWYDCFMYSSCTTPLPSDGTGNITSNPLFVDAANGDFRLQAGSPCIDAGNNAYAVGSVDMDGNPRIQGARVDMGAYEYGATAPVTLTVTFDGQGATPSPASKSMTQGQPYDALPAPTRTGYTFAGWFTAATGGTLVTAATVVTQTADHTLWAQWTSTLVGDYFVDAFRPNDSGDGKSWATAKKTIQAAINLAAAGSEIIVANGVYAPIMTDNKAITIRSVNGVEHTIIDGGGTQRCATLGIMGEQTNTVLSGFTLRNGDASHANVTIRRYRGGGAYGGTLDNCTLTGNTVTRFAISGGATHRSGGGAADGTLNNCTMSGNSADYGGGADSCILNNCLLFGNTATYGGGACSCWLNNCTVTGNTASYGGGVSNIGGWGGPSSNCIIWGNTSPNSANYYASTIQYSCTTPLPSGTGNIASDPLFVNAAGGDYRLQAGSPCIDAGNNAYAVGSVDMDGNPRIYNGRVDMGAYEWRPSVPSGTVLTVMLRMDAIFGFPLSSTVTCTNVYEGLPVTGTLGGQAFTYGWTNSVGTAVTNGMPFEAAGNATVLYARINSEVEPPDTVTVTFSGNGGTPSSQNLTQMVGEHYTLPSPDPTRTGHTFAGWFTAATGGTLVTAATVVTQTADHTLWAQWTEESPTTVTVTFSGNGGTPSSQNLTQTVGEHYILPSPNPTRTGYTFAGWFTAQTGGTLVNASTTVTQTSAHTLWARWTDNAATTCTVSFDAQGGAVSPESKGVTAGQMYGTLPTPTRPGYTFVGWFTAASSGTLVNAATTVTQTADHTVWARWVAVGSSPTVSAVADGPGTVTVSPSDGRVVKGKPVTLTAKPSKDAVFVDWSGGGEVFGTATIKVAPTVNTAYVARFRLKADCAAPEIGDIQDSPDTMVGVPFAMQVNVNDAAKPVKFSASKLPPGLKINAATGLISGVPTKAGVFGAVTVKVTSVANGKRTATRGTPPITIEALPWNAQGAFTGCVQSGDSIRGSFSATVSATGKFSAKVATTSGALSFSAPSWSGKAGNTFTVNAATQKGQTLALTLNASAAWNSLQMSGKLNGLDDVSAQRNPFANKKDAVYNHALIALEQYRGYYTMALFSGENSVISEGGAYNIPEGCGYLTATVNDKGAVKLVGKLADGTSVSGSMVLQIFSGDSGVPCFLPLYGSKGYYSGRLSISPNGRVQGDCRWFYPGKTPTGKTPATEDRFEVRSSVDGAYYGKVSDLADYYEWHTFYSSFFGEYSVGCDWRWYWSEEGGYITSDGKGGLITFFTFSCNSGCSDPEIVGGYKPKPKPSGMLKVNKATGLFSGKVNVNQCHMDANENERCKVTSVPHQGVLVLGSGGSPSYGAGFLLISEPWVSYDSKPVKYTIKRSYPVRIEEEY